jgi:hypothetical protein
MSIVPIAIERWESIASTRDFALLDQLLADDVVFESPVVHTPQVGRAITTRYLTGAVQVLGGPKARFVRRWFAEDSAVLELETEVDGVKINAVDIISWNSENRISHFKVMVRPLKAINVLHQAMAQLLADSGTRS